MYQPPVNIFSPFSSRTTKINMAGKKNKQATANRKSKGATRSDNNKRSNNDAAPQGARLSLSPIPGTRSLNMPASPIINTPSRPAGGKQDTLFVLPPEVRHIIYGHLLSTDIITTDEGRLLRRRTASHRQHDYQIGNFKPKQLSLTKVCKLVRMEILQRFWEQITFRFASTYVFARFVGAYRPMDQVLDIGSRNLPVLRRCANIQVVVKPERGTISGLLAAYEIGRLVNCSIEPDLLEDTPSTRMSAFCVEATRRRMADIKRNHELLHQGAEFTPMGLRASPRSS
ncbi:hypothetical protein D6D01_08556 [Aureobasidium pullulans]|uniref:F-box domain-containing protein n=1 Tax=Aureobasidium pullulans TaxID=5580 RepID=A0A4S9KBM5_AURPU|nr:hypothetical protein D6D01_08556 [Aureobasidium pullulans]